MIREYEKTVIVYLKCIMLFCAFYICVYNNTYGQDTLYGMVFDQDCNRPIHGATVSIRSTSIGTFTDKNGVWRLVVKDTANINKQVLLIEYLGNQTAFIEIGKRRSFCTCLYYEYCGLRTTIESYYHRYIIDMNDEPLSGVQISGKHYWSKSNECGEYRIDKYAVKGNVVLQFSKEGYKIVKYKIKKLPDTVQLKYDKKVELK